MNQIVTGCLIFVQLTTLPAINTYRLADAIYQAQGSYATSWPSGTINHYKNNTTRKECLYIIQKQGNLWDGNGDFIDFLAHTYSPVSSYWSERVKYFYYQKSRGGT